MEMYFLITESSTAFKIFCDIATLNIDTQDQSFWNNASFFPTYLYDQYDT